MRRPFVPALLLALALPVAAQDREEGIGDLLARSRAAHLDHVAAGLRSFRARLTLRRSEDPNMRAWKDLGHFGYSWAAPDSEQFDFADTHELLRKPLTDALRGMWRDLTGALWFDVLSKAGGLRLETGGSFHVLSGAVEKLGEVRAAFEAGAGALVEIEFAALDAKVAYVYEQRKAGLQVGWRDVSVGENRLLRITYGAFREVSGFLLPTLLTLTSERNTTEYGIGWREINGEPAKVAAPSEDEVGALVEAFEKGFRNLTDEQKVEAIRSLAETSHDLVAEAIAKQGLRDGSPAVRAQAAESLGVMKRPAAVAALIAAMKKNEKVPEVHLRVIQALGDIGDPRAVEALSKDWWNQRSGTDGVAAAKAKILALGNIPHVSAVDALLDTLYMAKDETLALVAAELHASLKKLTGQDFGADRRAWKDWWKKNRSRHEFE